MARITRQISRKTREDSANGENHEANSSKANEVYNKQDTPRNETANEENNKAVVD